jgi:hypothetical protein
MNNGDTSKALAPRENADELRSRIESEVPALVGGFQLGPRRLARVGKLHLGYKVSQVRASDGKEVTYPKECSWFVFEDSEVEAALVAAAKTSDVVEVDGAAHVTALEIIFPLNIIKENAEVVFAQYNSKRQCLCTSRDGVTARQMNPETGKITEIPCLNEQCPKRQTTEKKRADCSEVMRMRFIIPSIPPLGVWQLDTGSTWSKNSVLGYMRTLQAEITCGQLSGIRLRLSRASQMIPDKNTKRLQQHWPLHLVANISYDNYAETLAKARAMTYKPEDVEEFDEEPDETIVPTNGDGVIVDPESGEILLPEEQPMDAEFTPAGEPEDEPVGEPPAPAPAVEPKPPGDKPTNNEQVNVILGLAERVWTDRETAASEFKAWLAQSFDGAETVRQLTYQQAMRAIAGLQKILNDRARAGKGAKR